VARKNTTKAAEADLLTCRKLKFANFQGDADGASFVLTVWAVGKPENVGFVLDGGKSVNKPVVQNLLRTLAKRWPDIGFHFGANDARQITEIDD
jgi:hypothetical protein